jgi:hypothetical protein
VATDKILLLIAGITAFGALIAAATPLILWKLNQNLVKDTKKLEANTKKLQSNAEKLDLVHEAVNSNFTALTRRVDQLTATLQAKGIEVPDQFNGNTGNSTSGST